MLRDCYLSLVSTTKNCSGSFQVKSKQPEAIVCPTHVLDNIVSADIVMTVSRDTDSRAYIPNAANENCRCRDQCARQDHYDHHDGVEPSARPMRLCIMVLEKMCLDAWQWRIGRTSNQWGEGESIFADRDDASALYCDQALESLRSGSLSHACACIADWQIDASPTPSNHLKKPHLHPANVSQSAPSPDLKHSVTAGKTFFIR